MTVQVNQDPACCSWRASFLCWVCSTITERSTQPLSRRAVEISLSLGYLFSDCLTQIAKVIKCSTYDLMRDHTSGCWNCDPPHKMFNFWKVIYQGLSLLWKCTANFSWKFMPGPSAPTACYQTTLFFFFERKETGERAAGKNFYMMNGCGTLPPGTATWICNKKISPQLLILTTCLGDRRYSCPASTIVCNLCRSFCTRTVKYIHLHKYTAALWEILC